MTNSWKTLHPKTIVQPSPKNECYWGIEIEEDKTVVDEHGCDGRKH